MRLMHLLLLTSVFAARVQACECVVPGTIGDAYKHSTAVVAAEAISVSTALGPMKHGSDTINAETQTVESGRGANGT